MPGQTSDPIRMLHITDSHLFADADSSLRDTATDATLCAVLDHYQSSPWQADFIAMTGDVIQDDTAAAYRRFRDLVVKLDLPTYCVPGNHDVRPLMREMLGDSPFHYCASHEISNWLIAGIDSCTTDDAGGLIDAFEMQRLEKLLSSATAEHVAICLHHPPLPMDSKWLDQVGLRNGNAFLDLVSRSGKVRVVFFGHVHQEFLAEHNGIQIIGTPSTCRQFKAKADEFALDDKPPAYRQVELFTNGNVTTSTVWVTN